LVASPDRAKRAWRWTAVTAAVLAPAVVVAVWVTGLGPEWWAQFVREFWSDLATAETRAPEWPLVAQLLISTAALPLLAPWYWRRMSGTSRALTLIGAGYLALVLTGQQKTLHYLAPLPWICLVPALELATTRIQLTAVGLLAAAFALSWPSPRPVQRDAISLGRESCVQGLDYQAASLGADVVYDAFDRPATGARFSVGKHTFVRYAVDLGGGHCVIGLSPTTPEGAITIAAGPQASLWTTDIDRFVWWRFHEVPVPASTVFPRQAAPALPVTVDEWSGQVNIESPRGRALLLEHGHGRARLLVPITDPDDTTVLLGVRTSDEWLSVTMNGAPAPAAHVRAAPEGTALTGAWRRGWNIVEVTGAAALELTWITATRAREGR